MSPPSAAISLTNVEEMKEHSFEVGRKHTLCSHPKRRSSQPSEIHNQSL